MSRMPLRISIIYAVVSLLWIHMSDQALIFITQDPSSIVRLGMVKGYVFVAVTTIMLYIMLVREGNKRNRIEENLSQLVNIVKSSQDAIIGKNLDGIITSWNQGAEKLYGYRSSEAVGKHISFIFPENKHGLLSIILSKIKLGDVVDNFQTVTVRRGGKNVHVSVTISPIKNIKGEVIGASTIAMDVTRQKEDEKKLKESYSELSAVYEQLSAAEEELRAQYDELQYNQEIIRKSEERYKLALEGANDVIWEWNLETNEIFLSDKWKELTGFESREHINVLEVVKELANQEDYSRMVEDVRAHLGGAKEYYMSEFRIKTRLGEEKWVSNRGKLLKDETGKPYLMAGSLTDITERMKREEQIRNMAYYDSLTSLPNRMLFMEHLETELNRSLRKNTRGAVLFLDLDDFKRINDTMGHDYGDELLKNIARVLENCVRDGDVVGRFGGDEFMILLPNIKDYQDAADTSVKILNRLNEGFHIGGKQMFITSSIGMVIYPEDGDNTTTILKNMDTAMYRAKESGKNRYCFFDKSVRDAFIRKIEIEKGLREALAKGEIYLHYQPQIDIKSGKIKGMEALIRWKSGELGFVSPGEFITIAETTGLIVPIGEWVLKTACRQGKMWRDRGFDFETVSVNVSSVQLQQEKFISMIERVIEEAELAPGLLEIEITESILMRNMDDNVSLLREIKNRGIKVALDDFGTGYSSLSYLRKLPINTLKIDKSFIDDICEDDQNKAITDGIIQLAHKINVDVIVEGVEHHEQVDLLKEMECNVIQGYYFSKPLPVEEAEELLMNGSCKI